MAFKKAAGSKVDPKAAAAHVRHPIKAATLLYTAPAFILRGPIYMMFITMIAMLIYSIIATKDVLVVAPLKLQRQVVTVQAVSGGIVESLDVAENSVVSAGTMLAVIQEKIRVAATPEQEAIDRERRGYQERKDQLIRDYEFRRRQRESERADLERRLTTGRSSLENRIGQLRNQLQTAEAARRNIQTDLNTARATAGRLEPLCAKRDIPITQCEQARQTVANFQRALDNNAADIRNIELSIKTAEDELSQQIDQQTLERLVEDLRKMDEDYRTQMDQLDGHIAELDHRRELAQTLVPGVRPGRTPADRDKVYYTSVVDGIVTQVHVQRGQLINPGAPIVTIVRNTAPLEARVLIPNKDIGHLKIGQAVQIKYFAYPFQEYGIQTGSIADISTRPSPVPGEESFYVVHVALASETIRSRAGVDKPLEIGLQGIAEIKTGEKRFIELLFAPASKFFEPTGEEGGSSSSSRN